MKASLGRIETLLARLDARFDTFDERLRKL